MDHLKGLPESVATALGSVPVDDKAQLELAVRWPELNGAAARVCERLQVRVLTWDPLGWLDDRDADPVVTVEGRGSSYRLTLFLGAWELESDLFGTAAELLKGLVDSIVRVGARNEESLIGGHWLTDEEEGLVPSLLGALRPEVPGPGPEFDLVAGWRPIDEQTVAMVVAGEFGPVALDIGPHALPAANVRSSTCAACAGERFSVPFEIDLARPAMCAPHQKKALQVMLDAVRRAEKANAESWEVFCHAAADLLPGLHVPYPLRHRLVEAASRLTFPGDDDDLLAEQAGALLSFIEWVGTPERFESAMWDMGWRPIDGPASDDRAFEDFALTIAYRLGAAREFAVAAQLADALAALLPHMAANIQGELASQLAEAGRDEEGRARLQAALEHPSRDLLTQVYAGEVEEGAGDREAAEKRYRSALQEARRSQDAYMEHEILCHLIELFEDDDERAPEVAALRRQRDEAHARTATEPDEDEVGIGPTAPVTVGPKVGRNEPCPCRSGRKYKRCHGGAPSGTGDPSAVVDP